MKKILLLLSLLLTATVSAKDYTLVVSPSAVLSVDNPALFGEDNRDFLLTQIKSFYSDEDEEKYGVVGIRLTELD